MTTLEASKIIGTKKLTYAGKFIIEVEVLDHKKNFGRDLFQVTPIAGFNAMWVETIFDKEQLR